MFTGLIESLGKIKHLTNSGGPRRIVISAPQIASRLKNGDSVAVNGVCLTALDITPETFTADLAQETVERTALTRLTANTLVNLELPTPAGTPMGGHVVQGHVDGTGKVVIFERIPGREDWRMQIELPAEVEDYVVTQGSIAIEGISLTVAAIQDRMVSIAIIPHTYCATNLQTLKPGDPVNVEVDVLAKYAEKGRGARSASGVTLEKLLAAGF